MFTRHLVRPATSVARELARDRTLDDLEWAAGAVGRQHTMQDVQEGGADGADALAVDLAGRLFVDLLKADETPLTRRGLRALVANLYRRITEATTPAMRQAYRRAGRYLTQRWPGLTPGQREEVVGEVVDRMRADFIAAAIPTAPFVGDAVERTIAATRQATAARHRLTIQGLGAGAPPFHPNCRCTLIASFTRAVQVPAALPTAAPAPVMSDAARQRAGLAPTPVGRFQVQVIGGRPRVGPPLALMSPADASADWRARPNVNVTPELLERVFGKQVPKLDDLLAAWTDDEGGVEVRDLVVKAYGAANLNLSFLLYDRAGTLLTTKGRSSRTFGRHAGKLVVHNDFLRLSKAAPKGAGARITRNSLTTYSKIGVDTVEVDAAWIGKHAWATFGFQWDAAEAAKRRSAFTTWVQAPGGLSATEARRAVGRIDFAHPWEVADFDVPGRTVEVEIERDDDAGPTYTRSHEPLGKAFLLSQDMWSGSIDLTRPDAPSWRRALLRVVRQ